MATLSRQPTEIEIRHWLILTRCRISMAHTPLDPTRLMKAHNDNRGDVA